MRIKEILMINSTINDESFRLKITEIGLRKLLINKGSIEVLSYITSLYDCIFSPALITQLH